MTFAILKLSLLNYLLIALKIVLKIVVAFAILKLSLLNYLMTVLKIIFYHNILNYILLILRIVFTVPYIICSNNMDFSY